MYVQSVYTCAEVVCLACNWETMSIHVSWWMCEAQGLPQLIPSPRFDYLLRLSSFQCILLSPMFHPRAEVFLRTLASWPQNPKVWRFDIGHNDRSRYSRLRQVVSISTKVSTKTGTSTVRHSRVMTWLVVFNGFSTKQIRFFCSLLFRVLFSDLTEF